MNPQNATPAKRKKWPLWAKGLLVASLALNVLVILFLLFTAPIGAHLIARAAFRARVPYVGKDECKVTRDGFVAEDREE